MRQELPSPSQLSHRRTTAHYAFTLIEILVVVAIIGLLVAILVPSLSRARWQAKNVACKANLHDLGIAFQTYANTHREFFPVTTWGGEDSFLRLWRAKLLPEADLLLCPASRNVIRPDTLLNRENDKATVMSAADTEIGVLNPPSDIECSVGDTSFRCRQPGPGGPKDDQGGHSYEYQGMYQGAYGEQQHKKASNKLPIPYRALLVFDLDNDYLWAGAEGCENSWGRNGNNCPQPWDMHGEKGLNMMYADGHAVWQKKLGGLMTYHNRGNPVDGIWNDNWSIDMIWITSERPYVFMER